jgi:hypothetical protein
MIAAMIGRAYVDGWRAALDEMRRPDWREVHDRTSRDIAAGRGRDLDMIAKELGLESRPPAGHRASARRVACLRRQKNR